MAYLRSATDTATFRPYASGPEPPAPELYRDLRHGDILYDAGRYRDRSVGSFVVIEVATGDSATGGNAAGDSVKMVQPIDDENVLGIVRQSVSRRIEDPARFYAEIPAGTSLEAIELDVAAHRRFVETAAGGRPVHDSRVVRWYRDGGSATIRSPFSPDIPSGVIVVDLDASTPAEYLSGADVLLVDPTMATQRARNRATYEQRAFEYLRGLQPGTAIRVQSLPGQKNWHGSEGFIEFVDGAEAVVRTRRQRDVVTYTPRQVSDKGPYGGVYVWASDGVPRGNLGVEAGMLVFE